MKGIRKAIDRKKVVVPCLFVLIAISIFSVFYFTLLTGWTIEQAEYKLIVKAKGYVNNLTVTYWIRYFNASTAEITNPLGIRIDIVVDSSNKNSKVQIVFENFTDELAVVSFSNMSLLANIPVSGIPVDDSSAKFNYGSPAVEGNWRNCTNFFFHLSISANTAVGKIRVYASSTESIVTNNSLTWNDYPQSKDRTLTVAFWAFMLLSSTISATSITVLSSLLKIRIKFPMITLAIATIMCMVYVLIGVGNDILSSANVSLDSRILLSLFSDFFHSSYDHLMGNLLFFLIGGSLIELWLVRFYGRRCYVWYCASIPVSIGFSALGLVKSGFFSISTGASLWCIGIALALAISIIGHKENFMKLKSAMDIVALLISGYLLFGSTWNYLSTILIYYYSNTTVMISIFHLMFASIFTLVFVFFVFRRKKEKV